MFYWRHESFLMLVDTLNYIKIFPHHYLHSTCFSAICRDQGEEEEVHRWRITVEKVLPSLERSHITNYMGPSLLKLLIFIFAVIIYLLQEEIWVISSAKDYDLEPDSVVTYHGSFPFPFGEDIIEGSEDRPAWNSKCSELGWNFRNKSYLVAQGGHRTWLPVLNKKAD